MAVILVVDDEHAIVETVVELLTWEGHTALVAENGQRALEVIEEQQPDLVLLDYMMPLMDGMQTLTELRATPRGASLPVILMTAAPMSVVKQGARFDHLLVKPFTVERLRAAIQAVLAGR